MGIFIGTSTKNQGHISLGNTSYGKVFVGDKLVWQKDSTPVIEDFIYKGEVWEYGTVTSPTGRIWMDRNLGASRVAEAITDPEGYGDYFQWGRGDDLHQNKDSARTSTLSSTDFPGHGSFITTNNSPWDWRVPQNNNLWQGVGGINVPAPTGWRLPTMQELADEMHLFEPANSVGAFNSILKLPSAGRRIFTGDFNDVGAMGHYWSSTSADTGRNSTLYYSWYLYFTSSRAFVNNASRNVGRSVRLIKD